MIIWILDSFFLNLSTFLRASIPLWIHLVIAVIIFFIGIFLINRSEKILFKSETTGLETSGILGRIRNPMYLGSILLYIAAPIGTLSLLSLIPLFVGFIVYDRMAEYEGKRLEEKYGQEYLDYKEKVPKWLPIKRGK